MRCWVDVLGGSADIVFILQFFTFYQPCPLFRQIICLSGQVLDELAGLTYLTGKLNHFSLYSSMNWKILQFHFESLRFRSLPLLRIQSLMLFKSSKITPCFIDTSSLTIVVVILCIKSLTRFLPLFEYFFWFRFGFTLIVQLYSTLN